MPKPLPWRPNPRPPKGPTRAQLERAELEAHRDEGGLTIDLVAPADVVPLTPKPKA